jgi:glutamyl-tRNA synthetase
VTKVKCRFAPSPTGHLHIGGARTALFNWLFARHEDGEFILRIEDTDIERSKDEYTKAIMAGLEWLGIDWDGEPIFQTGRMDRYKEAVDKLLTDGKAYYCSCTPEEVDKIRDEMKAAGNKPKYDGRCRDKKEHPEGRAKVVRFRSPDSEQTVVEDLHQGTVTFDNEETDDLVLVRSDGSPTYNLCAVVDDHELGITHVSRGNDHLNNTPRQIQIYEAFGWEPPIFAHHPLILGQDKSKLSKRHGATSLIAYKDMGYLPEAMRTFLVRMGWSHGDQETFAQDELVKLFELHTVGKSPAVWDPEKLLWLNGFYIREASIDDLAQMALPFYKEAGIEVENDDRFKKIIKVHQERVKTILEYPQTTKYYFIDEVEFEEKPKKKFLKEKHKEILEKVRDSLTALSDFNEQPLEDAFVKIMGELDLKLGKVAQPVRVALTGGSVSPSLFEVMAIMGKDLTLKRIERAIKEIDNKGE